MAEGGASDAARAAEARAGASGGVPEVGADIARKGAAGGGGWMKSGELRERGKEKCGRGAEKGKGIAEGGRRLVWVLSSGGG